MTSEASYFGATWQIKPRNESGTPAGHDPKVGAIPWLTSPLAILVRRFDFRLVAATNRAVAPAVMDRLRRRSWPGNVRELANEIARLCLFSEGDLLDPDLVREPTVTATAPGPAGPTPLQPLADLERDAIFRALERCGGDKRKAAELLGISRAKIYQRLKEYREE